MVYDYIFKMLNDVYFLISIEICVSVVRSSHFSSFIFSPNNLLCGIIG